MAELDEWPKTYHPAHYEGIVYVVDLTTSSEGWQLRPDTWADLSLWCSGQRVLDTDGNQALQVGGQQARLGDFVMQKGGAFTVEPADGHYQRWHLE